MWRHLPAATQGLARTRRAEKSHFHTISAVSRQVYVHALLVQYLYGAFYQHVAWYCETSETALMQRRQKI